MLADIIKRDERDQNRAAAPLKAAADAHILDNSSLDIEGGVRAAIAIVEAVRANGKRGQSISSSTSSGRTAVPARPSKRPAARIGRNGAHGTGGPGQRGNGISDGQDGGVSTIRLFMMVFPLFLQWRECRGRCLRPGSGAVAAGSFRRRGQQAVEGSNSVRSVPSALRGRKSGISGLPKMAPGAISRPSGPPSMRSGLSERAGRRFEPLPSLEESPLQVLEVDTSFQGSG